MVLTKLRYKFTVVPFLTPKTAINWHLLHSSRLKQHKISTLTHLFRSYFVYSYGYLHTLSRHPSHLSPALPHESWLLHVELRVPVASRGYLVDVAAVQVSEARQFGASCVQLRGAGQRGGERRRVSWGREERCVLDGDPSDCKGRVGRGKGYRVKCWIGTWGIKGMVKEKSVTMC